MNCFPFMISKPISKCTTLGVATLGILLANVAAPALAAEVWIACEGTVVKKADNAAPTSTPVNDTYVYDDSARLMYRYTPATQKLALLPITSFDAKSIAWKNVRQGTGPTWEGSLDRASMTMRINRVDSSETMDWKQACKPASVQAVK